MAIEDKNDKQIQDLLENNFPLKAIKVDFRDLNNKTLIIKSAFGGAYTYLNDWKDNWFYIARLNEICNTIDLIGIVNMTIASDGWLDLNWIETNKVFKKKNYSKEIIDYLKRFVKWRHLKGIVANCVVEEDLKLFKYNNFKPIGNNSLIMKWSGEES